MSNEICLNWAVGLHTPIDLNCFFNSVDLKNEGAIINTHIQIYNFGEEVEKSEIKEDIDTFITGKDRETFDYLCEDEDIREVSDLFDLNVAEIGNSDFITLDLKTDSAEYELLRTLYKSLGAKYDKRAISTPFRIKLAEFMPGTAHKYLDSIVLGEIMESTYFNLGDLYLDINGKEHFLTSHKVVDRFFRLERLKESRKLLMKD